MARAQLADVDQRPFAVEQLEHPEPARPVCGLGGPERLLGLWNQHVVEQADLPVQGFDAHDRIVNLQLHGVARRLPPPDARAQLRVRLPDLRAVLRAPERHGNPQRDGERVPAVVRKRRQVGRTGPAPDVDDPHARGEARPGAPAGQLDGPFAALDERAGRPQLVAVPFAEAVQPLAVEREGGPRQARHGRHRIVRRPVAQGVEAGREHGAPAVEPEPAVDDPGDLRLQPDHRLQQALAGGVAGPGQRLVVRQQRLLFAGEAERRVDVSEVVVDLLDLRGDVPPGRLMQVAQRLRLQPRDPAPQGERAEPGERLGQRHAVDLRADPGLHAAQRLREADDRVGQGGDPRRPAQGGFVARTGLEDGGIAFHRRGHVGAQIRRRGVEVERVLRRRRPGGAAGLSSGLGGVRVEHVLRRRRLGGGERRDQDRRGRAGGESPGG